MDVAQWCANQYKIVPVEWLKGEPKNGKGPYANPKGAFPSFEKHSDLNQIKSFPKTVVSFSPCHWGHPRNWAPRNATQPALVVSQAAGGGGGISVYTIYNVSGETIILDHRAASLHLKGQALPPNFMHGDESVATPKAHPPIVCILGRA